MAVGFIKSAEHESVAAVGIEASVDFGGLRIVGHVCGDCPGKSVGQTEAFSPCVRVESVVGNINKIAEVEFYSAEVKVVGHSPSAACVEIWVLLYKLRGVVVGREAVNPDFLELMLHP